MDAPTRDVVPAVHLTVLAFASQRLRMPAADGTVYCKGEGH